MNDMQQQGVCWSVAWRKAVPFEGERRQTSGLSVVVVCDVSEVGEAADPNRQIGLAKEQIRLARMKAQHVVGEGLVELSPHP